MIGITNDPCFRLIFLLLMIIGNTYAEYNKLEMVHVIFRHGTRTPTKASEKRYPNDPHLNNTYFPNGLGNLNNEGKINMYNLGTFLRRRYNSFLGEVYYAGVTRVRTTDSSRTMMSAQLVNAGLWPPQGIQQWNKDLLWIPIPYEYDKSSIDSLMYSYGCPAFLDEYKRVIESEEIQKLVAPHLKFFAYLGEHTGLRYTRPQEVLYLYEKLMAQTNNNLTLESWTKGYFPDGEMYDVALLAYDIYNWGDRLKRIYGGPLLRDVLHDYRKFIENTSSSDLNPKITLYSGHESNICSVQKALGVWTPHIPDFSATIIFELYSNNSTREFGIQIHYYLGRSGKIIPLTLPGCTQICPINNFTSLLSNVIPDDLEDYCGTDAKSGEGRSSFVSLMTITYITLQTCILVQMT